MKTADTLKTVETPKPIKLLKPMTADEYGIVTELRIQSIIE